MMSPFQGLNNCNGSEPSTDVRGYCYAAPPGLVDANSLNVELTLD